MKTPRFLVCSCCDEIYSKPQEGSCLSCGDDAPEWREWDPRIGDTPKLDQIADIIVGLLMELEDQGKMTDDDGRLYAIVRDALVVVCGGGSDAYSEFYLQTA